MEMLWHHLYGVLHVEYLIDPKAKQNPGWALRKVFKLMLRKDKSRFRRNQIRLTDDIVQLVQIPFPMDSVDMRVGFVCVFSVGVIITTDSSVTGIEEGLVLDIFNMQVEIILCPKSSTPIKLCYTHIVWFGTSTSATTTTIP